MTCQAYADAEAQESLQTIIDDIQTKQCNETLKTVVQEMKAMRKAIAKLQKSTIEKQRRLKKDQPDR